MPKDHYAAMAKAGRKILLAKGKPPRERGKQAGKIAGVVVGGAIGLYGATQPPYSGAQPLRPTGDASTQERRSDSART